MLAGRYAAFEHRPVRRPRWRSRPRVGLGVGVQPDSVPPRLLRERAASVAEAFVEVQPDVGEGPLLEGDDVDLLERPGGLVRGHLCLDAVVHGVAEHGEVRPGMPGRLDQRCDRVLRSVDGLDGSLEVHQGEPVVEEHSVDRAAVEHRRDPVACREDPRVRRSPCGRAVAAPPAPAAPPAAAGAGRARLPAAAGCPAAACRRLLWARQSGSTAATASAPA